jgi:2-polyprenyl-3-methyl-5-hydroxy-6-metoxy-1,4-benzoquinol methylase
MGKFNQRSYQKEIMDDLEVEGSLLKQTLKELRVINRFLGGNSVTTSGLDSLIHKGQDREYTIADIGCGGGDMMKVMAKWAEKRKLKCHFIGIDANPNTIEIAKINFSDYSNFSFVAQNVFSEDFQKDKVDIITCTLFTHHFTDQELIHLIDVFKNKARIGIIINDLHRHPLAYYSIRILTALFSKSDMVKNDGPLSVLRGFKLLEIKNILQKANLLSHTIRWNWAFRWQVICKIN